ncbi:MAG: flagellar hook-basal body complex protein [Verrucomicrobia bacterium]|nr:flagellar hook-basal body complex protein [Verrucomicrobiota bacterium]
MLGSLQTGVSGLQQFQQRLDVIGNNIANVGTTGFKSARMDFEDTFSRTLDSASGGLQIGTGVGTAAIRSQFTQGAINKTSVGTDLAVQGQGFFVVRDTGSGESFATRAGEFRLNDEGYLITNFGMRVQGLNNGGSAAEDLKIDGSGAPATTAADAKMTSFSIGSDGKIKVRMSDGTEFVRGQVLLQSFTAPENLMKEGNNLLSGFAAAGALSKLEAPKTNGLGHIEAGSLEMSNVDLAGEMSSLITTQRAFQASARIVTTSDEFLQELVNLKR